MVSDVTREQTLCGFRVVTICKLISEVISIDANKECK